MSVKKTLTLIKNYQNDVGLFMDLFFKKYSRSDVIQAWRNGDIPQNGKVSDLVEYELHGIGCNVSFPDREVDFDFSPELSFDGFDLWRLQKYVRNDNRSETLLSLQELEDGFKGLVQSGVISKPYKNSELYFFAGW